MSDHKMRPVSEVQVSNRVREPSGSAFHAVIGVSTLDDGQVKLDFGFKTLTLPPDTVVAVQPGIGQS